MTTNRASWILSSSSSVVSYTLFKIMSSLKELRVATFIPDLLKTCLFEFGTNRYRTCPVHVNKMAALKVMSLTTLQRRQKSVGCWELHHDKMVDDIFSIDKKETEMSDCVTGENT